MQGNVIIQLNNEDLITVERILLDKDSELALQLVRDKIEPAIKNNQGEHCKSWE